MVSIQNHAGIDPVPIPCNENIGIRPAAGSRCICSSEVPDPYGAITRPESLLNCILRELDRGSELVKRSVD
jgi:hypothetical protein